MPYYCTVPRCTSMAGKVKNVSFHQFPRDEELANLWNEVLKRGKPYTKYSKVCSLHFKPEDYTITSVGKNKGQWRTLRKDAVPSQNLPSDSPPPIYRVRRQSSYMPTSTPTNAKSMNHSFDAAGIVNMMPKDLVRSYEMAQAIYMQTMLAMQSTKSDTPQAITNQNPESPSSRCHTPTSSNTSNEQTDRSNGQIKTEIGLIPSNEVTLKCDKCLKLFKDPDVFMLHKRIHVNSEKENLICNETLKANPILANLLKAGIKPDGVLDVNNILSIENQIMTALTANMETYIRNLSSLIKAEPRSSDDQEEVGSSSQNIGNCSIDSSCNSDALAIDEAV